MRQEFLIKFRANFKTQLDNIEIVDEDEKEENKSEGSAGSEKDEHSRSFCLEKETIKI